MLSQALLSGLIGLLAGLIGSFVGFWYWPALRRRTIWNGLRVIAEPHSETGGLWCRVINGSSYSMGKAIAYITIHHEPHLVRTPPAGREAYITPTGRVPIRQMQLCWAVQERGENPMRVDIYAGEEQPLIFGFVADDFIEILSERAGQPARAFLFPTRYTGILKIVCLDCEAKEFPFKIDPSSSAQTPITFHPDYVPVTEPGPLPSIR